MANLDRWVPALTCMSPLIAFGLGGTAVPISPSMESFLLFAAWLVLLITALSIVLDTVLARVTAGAAMICWWISFIVAVLAVDHPRTSAFGILSLAAIPIIIAFTWGKPWIPHDLKDVRK